MVNAQALVGAAILLSTANAAAIVRRDCSFTWEAEKGDTCQSLASDWGISTEQFVSWNDGVVCNALVDGKEYCLLWDGPVPGAPTTTSTTAKATTSSKATTTTTAAPTTTASPTGPSPTQAGIVSDCQTYHKAVSGDSCLGIVQKYGAFSLEQFYTWNPAVGTQCGGLWLDYYYCVAVKGTPASPTTTTKAPSSGPTPVQSGIASNCQRYHLVKSGDSCQAIVDQYKTFSLTQFYGWNPAVGSSCQGLWLDNYVCIGVPGTPTTAPAPGPTSPSPVQPNVNPKCNKWYQVVSGDYCEKIASQFGISVSTFYSWNPSVGNTCASLWLGYYTCVGSS